MNCPRAHPLAAAALILVFATCASVFTPARAVDGRPAESIAARSFATPDRAARALYKAAKGDEVTALRAVLGPGSGRVIDSGDPAEDAQGRARFVAAYERAARIELHGRARAILVLGDHDWPFPFPLVKSGDQWHFDVKAGRDEVLARRIGRNELSAIQAALAYVDAQREYVVRSVDKDRERDYAQRFVSTPNDHDGLYWDKAPGEGPSPIGPLFAAAAQGDTPATRAAPYHGYYFRILRAQGRHAPGGATDYVANGKMIGGFALVAYPARYRASGVKTFVVNHEGIVYGKDLGRDSAAIAQAIARYDPDASWQRETLEAHRY